MAEKKLIGKVTHYFSNLSVAVVELSAGLKVGDKIAIEGPKTKLEQAVDSMQIEKDAIQEAKKGQAIGLKTKDKVRPGDVVYRLVEEAAQAPEKAAKPKAKAVKKK